MTTTSQIVEEIVRRASELLECRVAAVDSYERTLAEAGGEECPERSEPYCVRVPLSAAGPDVALMVFQGTRPDIYPQHLIERIVELVVNEIVVLGSMPNQNELKNHFVRQLLEGTTESDVNLLREGQMLGMDLTRPRAVILVDASAYLGGEKDVKPARCEESMQPKDWIRAHYIIRRIVSFFALPSEAICAYIGNGQIAVLKATSSRDLPRWANGGQDVKPSSWSNLSALKRAARDLVSALQLDTGEQIRVGIGRYHPGIKGIARSYQDARAALNIGRFSSDPGHAHCLDDLGMAALIGTTDEEIRRDLACHLLGPLDAEPELCETLEAFFKENCSPAGCSSRLFIHRNTLTYRLDKIASLIGLNPRNFEDAMLIRLALMMRKLTSDSVGQVTD